MLIKEAFLPDCFGSRRQRGIVVRSVVFTTAMIARLWFSSHPSLVVASLDKILHDNYLCLVESNKQQIKEVRSKTPTKNSGTKATPKRVCIRPMYSASFAFTLQEDKDKEINYNNNKVCKTFFPLTWTLFSWKNIVGGWIVNANYLHKNSPLIERNYCKNASIKLLLLRQDYKIL